MGQYWQIVNKDKKECLNPWDFGEGAKLYEWPMRGHGGMQSALVILLLDKSSLGDGGGDFSFENAPHELTSRIGSWNGDAITIVGDYTPNEKDYPNEDNSYEDISRDMVELIKHEKWLAR